MKVLKILLVLTSFISTNAFAINSIDKLAIDLIETYNNDYAGRKNVSNTNGIWLKGATVSFSSSEVEFKGAVLTSPGSRRLLTFFYVNEDESFVNLIRMDQTLGIIKEEVTKKMRNKAIRTLCERPDKSGSLYSLLRNGYSIIERIDTADGWHLVDYEYDLSSC
tara:strand:- start:23490 stop:23981 length:492 start_codon:yes stop_codon:yes gene_type:complete